MKNKKYKNKNYRKSKHLKSSVERPRLSVYRSNRYIYVQIIDDYAGKTLVSANERELKLEKGNKLTKTQKAQLLGKLIAQKAIKLKIKKVIFDRNRFRYHGRVKSIAQEARAGGLNI